MGYPVDQAQIFNIGKHESFSNRFSWEKIFSPSSKEMMANEEKKNALELLRDQMQENNLSTARPFEHHSLYHTVSFTEGLINVLTRFYLFTIFPAGAHHHRSMRAVSVHFLFHYFKLHGNDDTLSFKSNCYPKICCGKLDFHNQ